MQVKLNDLQGQALLWAIRQVDPTVQSLGDWMALQSLVEREKVSATQFGDTWHCSIARKPNPKASSIYRYYGYDEARLFAQAKAIIAFKLGFIVEVPDNLKQ